MANNDLTIDVKFRDFMLKNVKFDVNVDIKILAPSREI